MGPQGDVGEVTPHHSQLVNINSQDFRAYLETLDDLVARDCEDQKEKLDELAAQTIKPPPELLMEVDSFLQFADEVGNKLEQDLLIMQHGTPTYRSRSVRGGIRITSIIPCSGTRPLS